MTYNVQPPSAAAVIMSTVTHPGDSTRQTDPLAPLKRQLHLSPPRPLPVPQLGLDTLERESRTHICPLTQIAAPFTRTALPHSACTVRDPGTLSRAAGHHQLQNYVPAGGVFAWSVEVHRSSSRCLFTCACVRLRWSGVNRLAAKRGDTTLAARLRHLPTEASGHQMSLALRPSWRPSSEIRAAAVRAGHALMCPFSNGP
jgi:hypothetical protein